MKHKLTKYLLLLIDILIVVFAFLFVAKIRDGTRRILADFIWWRSLIAFTVIWIISGLWVSKYTIRKEINGLELVKRIVKADIFAVAVVFGLIYIFHQFNYSRMIVLGTILGSVVLEVFIFVGIFYAFRFHIENRDFATAKLVTRSKALEEVQNGELYLRERRSVPAISDAVYAPDFSVCDPADVIPDSRWHSYLGDGEELLGFVRKYLDLERFFQSKTLVLQSETYSQIERELPNSLQLFVNLGKINDLRRINLYLIKINELLIPGGVCICRGQTITERRQRFSQKYTPVLGAPLYFLDFIFRRVMPKLPVFQGWYFALTKGRNRALSETEMLGRFYFCGFELIHKREIDGLMHFIWKKVNPPRTDPSPTYGPFIRLKRLGQQGKVIYVKKLRTMHPYSEYLQDYVYQTNDLQEGGKFKNDFRVTSWGKVLRALWIDELPQFYNFFKGELSLVGVRALSEHYFSLYPPDMQALRLKVKPGLMPPFYTDMPATFEEIVESERRYLQHKLQKPFATDWKYFWKGAWNILINKARSN